VVLSTHPYDDAGFPYRYWRGVLPSNSLAAMNALTRASLTRLLPADVPFEVHTLEDGIRPSSGSSSAGARRFPEPGTKLLVGLVAVSDRQCSSPGLRPDRAQWQRLGATCALGGFHVSGSISTLLDGIHDATRKDVPCPKTMPPEIAALMERGITVFHGEAEDLWASVLEDLLHDRAQPLYRGGKPDLMSAPLPDYPDSYFDGSFVTEMGTFDTGAAAPSPAASAPSSTSGPEVPLPRARRDRGQGQETCQRAGWRDLLHGRQLRPHPSGRELLDSPIELRRRPDAQLHGGGRPRLPQDPALPGEAGRGGCADLHGRRVHEPHNLADAARTRTR
jgi:hypothetical protein